MLKIDTQAATERLLRFLAVPGITGEEGKIAKEIWESLRAVGVPAKSIRHDAAEASANKWRNWITCVNSCCSSCESKTLNFKAILNPLLYYYNNDFRFWPHDCA